MALEDKIDLLIEALNKNTAALAASDALRSEALAVAKTVAAEAPAAAPKAEKKATAPKAEAPKEEPKAEAPAAAPETNIYAGIKELIAEYLGVERPEERAARQTKVINLLNHEKVKKADVPADAKPDVANIAPESIDLFKSQMRLLKEKGDLTTPATAETALDI
ncbi:hypothetical protein RCCWILLIS_8 [Rhodobacter phage RcCWillis]|nr:hypothetical protein RCCWILLIS_8 [Rhodobacter phage RcCWillis]